MNENSIVAPRRGNCLWFALKRWVKSGGKSYLIIRKSHFGWWFHAIWSADLVTFEEFAPTEHNHHLRFPPLIFRGVVKITAANEQSLLRKTA